MFGDYDLIIKVVPPLLGVLNFLSICRICELSGCSRNSGLMVGILFCGTAPFMLVSTTLYAENLLLLYIIWGTCFIIRYLRGDEEVKNLLFGILLLAGASCVKNEGLIYFALVLFYMIVYFGVKMFREGRREIAERKKLRTDVFKFVIYATAIFAVFILPWLLFRYFNEIKVHDFDFMGKMQLIIKEGFADNGAWEFKVTLNKLYRNMFVDLKLSCGVWYCFILSLFFIRWRLFKAENLFLLWFIVVPIAIYAVSFIFSVRNLDWHAAALPRLLLPPVYFAWLVVVKMEKYEEDSHECMNGKN